MRFIFFLLFLLNLRNFASPGGDYLMSISLIHSLSISSEGTAVCFLYPAIFTMYRGSGTRVYLITN